MPQTSFALLTNLGRAKEAAALANATTIEITHIAIGDGATVPSGGETALYHEVDRKTISGHGTVVGADNVAYFDCYLAAADGPYTIREAGLYDSDGDMIAIAHYDPPIMKPVPASGQTVEATVRLEVAFSNIATVVIVVDPSIQVALQRLTVLPWIPIKELYRNAPPASPVPGDVYVVGPTPTGAWAGSAGKVTEYTLAGWAMITPPAGHGVSTPDGKVYERVSGSYVEKIALDVQSGKWLYNPAGGTANVITVTLDPAPLAYRDGLVVRVKLAHRITGSSVINVNSLGNVPIVRVDGSPTKDGDGLAGEGATLLYIGGAFQKLGVSPFAAEILSAPRDYYVNGSTGNDSNDGRTWLTAFRRINMGTTAVSLLDLNGYTGSVHVADGTYNESVQLPTVSINGTAILVGNDANWANCHINSPAGSAIITSQPGSNWTVHGFKVTGSVGPGDSGQGIWVTASGRSVSYYNIEFGACPNAQVSVNGGSATRLGAIKISGGGNAHVSTYEGQVVANGSYPIDFIGTPAFAAGFMYIQMHGYAAYPISSVTGSCTGPRYLVNTNGILGSFGNDNYYPGSIDGSKGTQGQVI